MPGKNLEKTYLDDAYYHVYSRGVNKQAIFIDTADYVVFLNLFKRYLSNEPVKDAKGREYPWYKTQIKLLSFCLMPNHIHILVYQLDAKAMTLLMRSIITTYSMYFNKKYKRVGPLFQSRYRASMITDESYLQHISRYIHLNPKGYKEYRYSSYPYYTGKQKSEWLKPKMILDLFKDTEEYVSFVADYEDYKDSLVEIKNSLA